MKICAIADLHGYLPEIPECDLLLLGGDYCPVSGTLAQASWLENRFGPWLAELAERCTVVGVAGNHDFLFQERPRLVPKLPWRYLQDSGTDFRGLKIWGSPWQPIFFDWAFNLDEPALKEKWALIPAGTDILLLHGPPRLYGDYSEYSKKHTGSYTLLDKIEEIRPRLVVCGHIHEGFGEYKLDETTLLNVSYVDEKYVPAHKPTVIEI